MNSSYTVIRVPQAYRITRTIPSTTRTMSFFPTPYLPRFPGFPSHEFAPLFRILDDYTSQAQRALDFFSAPPSFTRAPQIFPPRFAVREAEDAYELRVKLPNVDPSQLEVEFDGQTLVIRRRAEAEPSSAAPPQATLATAAAPEKIENVNTSADATAVQAEASAEQVNATAPEPAVDSDAMSTHSSSSYQKATVEDEDGASASTPGQATPAESTVGSEQPEQTS